MYIKKTDLICAAILFWQLVGSAYAEKPYWWDNPHKDDESDMYECGTAEECETEQKAMDQAVLGARKLLIDRIGIVPALKDAGLSPSPEYALVNCTKADAATEKKGKKWTAWVLLKYPQQEKDKLLARWNASIASMQDLKKTEISIPVQFGLSLTTVSGKTQYREGDYASFRVSADRDVYLLLLDHQSDGTTVVLFPNRFHPDSLIPGKETIIIPDPLQYSFRLVIGPPFGDDRIEAIASTEKTSLQEKMHDLLDTLPSAQAVATSSRGIFVKGVSEAVHAAPEQVLWSRAELNLSTYDREK